MAGFGMLGTWAAGAAFGVISSIVMIPILAIFLWLTTKLFKPKDTSFPSALIVSAIIGLVQLISVFFTSIPYIGWLFSFMKFFLMIFLGIYLVKWKYNVDWGKAFLIWLVWILMTTVVFGIFAFIIWIIGMLTLGVGMMGLGTLGMLN